MKPIIDWIFKNKLSFITIACVLLCILLFRQCSQKSYYKRLNKQNQEYYTDSIKTLKNKAGELEYERTLLISDKKNLKEANEKLYNELIKEQGKVIALTDAVIKIKSKVILLHDSIYLIDTSQNIYRTKFDKLEFYTTDKLNYLNVEGYTDLQIGYNDKLYIISKGTFLTKNEFGVHMKLGYKEIDGKLKVFVASDHPYFSVTNLDAVIIEDKLNTKASSQKIKRIGIGPNISVGTDTKFKPAIFIGIGIQYNFLRF